MRLCLHLHAVFLEHIKSTPKHPVSCVCLPLIDESSKNFTLKQLPSHTRTPPQGSCLQLTFLSAWIYRPEAGRLIGRSAVHESLFAYKDMLPGHSSVDDQFPLSVLGVKCKPRACNNHELEEKASFIFQSVCQWEEAMQFRTTTEYGSFLDELWPSPFLPHAFLRYLYNSPVA